MKKTKSKFEKIVKILCAMLLAAIQIVGYSFSKQNNWNLVIKDGRISGKAIVIWAIGSILVYACISFIYLILDRMMDTRDIKEDGKITYKQLVLLALVILLCWLPYMILFYPGCANPDVQDQLGQFFHNETMCWTRKYVNLVNPQHSYWNNHHPVFHTLVLGIFAQFGKQIGHISVGIFLLTLIQMILMAGIFAYILLYLKKMNFNNVVSGATATPYQTEKSEQYIQEIANNGAYVNSKAFSYHVYSSSENMKWLKDKNNSHKSIINELGGFQRLYITEYGINSRVVENEDIRGERIIEQTITNEKQGIDYSFLYNFIDDFDNSQYGLIDKKNLPKKTYYAMKNYLQNTNGAEYIGTVNIAEGLEGHVYDKGGKPIIITWSENSTNNIQIDYKDFTAKDLYGKDIQPDENGKLTITTSPVYLYDVDYNYFYKAISNVATSKYDEFKEKFATEILQISGFEEKINQRQNYSQSVANTQKLMQNTAITAMKRHYELGDIILKAYEEGQLKAEPVKISSMLDMINDIGNSYEDLVTVSVNNTINSVMKTLDEANVDSSELTTTKQKIDETENLINTNTDVEIIYPTKILQFSKECYEKSDYINSLEEQNDIKAGLIISNNLHAQLLANWANKFASIQINNNINEYIAQNSVTIEYSETNITNKSVKATIKTNAEIQITNNSNSKEYVFDQNGSFTFEYTIKGQAKQITAKVTNIDKTSPIINGVIDGKLYTSKITPTITDENLDTIKLILNGEEVKNFKSGTTLTEEGFYTLTAIDKAGNKTQISFQIMENNNQNYIIQDNIIKNISEQTKKSDFDNKLKLEITYKIARNDEEINEKDNIATGDVLTTSAGDKYTLIVTGDLNKDGKLDLKDLVKMRKYFLDGNNLDENEILAADCNFDGKINLKDLVKMRLMLLNQDATK